MHSNAFACEVPFVVSSSICILESFHFLFVQTKQWVPKYELYFAQKEDKKYNRMKMIFLTYMNIGHYNLTRYSSLMSLHLCSCRYAMQNSTALTIVRIIILRGMWIVC